MFLYSQKWIDQINESVLDVLDEQDDKGFVELFMEAMSPQEAMKILDIGAEDAGDPDLVKKAYRKASLENHPDYGGSTEAMQKVNAAYEVLEGGRKFAGGSKVDWEAIAEKYRVLAVFVKDYLQREVKVENFLNHLKKWDDGLEVKDIKFTPTEGHPSVMAMTVKFANTEGTRVLKVQFYVSLHNLAGEAKLGAEDISIPMVVSTFLYVDGKDQKIKQRNYDFTSNKSVLIDPEEIFPSRRMEKIFTGEARKGSKFSRRDMTGALINELSASLSGDDAYLPIGEGEDGEPLTIRIYRVVLMRQPGWFVAGVWKNYRMANGGLISGSFPEEYATIQKLKRIQAAAKEAAPADKIKVAQEMFKKEKEAT